MFSDYQQPSHQALPINDGKLDYFSCFLSEKDSLALEQQLLEEVSFEQNAIKLFGKQIAVPRLEAYFSLNGENLDALFWYGNFLAIRKRNYESCAQFKKLKSLSPYYKMSGYTVDQMIQYNNCN